MGAGITKKNFTINENHPIVYILSIFSTFYYLRWLCFTIFVVIFTTRINLEFSFFSHRNSENFTEIFFNADEENVEWVFRVFKIVFDFVID